MTTLGRSVTLGAISILAAACADPLGPEESHVGIYHLRTVNGAALPFTIAQLGYERVEVTAGLIILHVDGTFVDRTLFRITESGGTRDDETRVEGTYSTNGSVVQLSPDGADRYTVAISDNRTLMQTLESWLLVYSK